MTATATRRDADRGRAMTGVKVVKRWSGYCAACDDDRPLVLAEIGGRRTLRELFRRRNRRRYVLSCRHCGTIDDVLV